MSRTSLLRTLIAGVATSFVAAHGASAQVAAQPGPVEGDQFAEASTKAPEQRPAGAGTVLQLPFLRLGRPYADVTAEVFTDGRILYERASLLSALTPMIAEGSRSEFGQRLPAADFLTPEQIKEAGVVLTYDEAQLQVVVESIDPKLAPLEVIGGTQTRSDIPVTVLPADFSAYVNFIGDLRVQDFNDFEDPGLIISGAVRYRGVVFEFDGGYDPQLTGEKGFYRRAARLVYDQIDDTRRWSAGDLQLLNSPLLGGVLMGGVGVEHGRRIFTGLAPLQPLGPQQMLIERDSTLDVFVDGQQAETLQLTSGPYDLSSLLARYGGRKVQLFVTDVSGRRQLTDLDTFFDPMDLAAGETEYSAGVGFVAKEYRAEPIYGGKPAFSGYYRRGISNRLILGGAIQLSENTQLGLVELVATPRGIPGRFEFSGAVSTGDSIGVAARGAYSIQWGAAYHASQFSLSADYRSSGFRTLADQILFDQVETLNMTASFSHSLSERTSIITGLNWFERKDFPSTRQLFADVVHRTNRFRLTAGVEYGKSRGQNDFGVRLGLSIPFGHKTRAEASYNGRREEFRTFVSKSYDDRVGSFGYDIGVRRSPADASVDGSLTYVANRFFSRFTATTGGPSWGDIDRRQYARLQVGTSLAYAGGSLAMGRPINDSFLIAAPHPSLGDQQVVIGESVHDRRYDAESGALGPALAPRLNSYVAQSMVYDLKNGAQGYDIGTGIHQVDPPYKSGYKITVGTDANVSAFGFVTLPTGPAELVSGRITSTDDSEFGDQPFFTNSAGRFAIIGLRPGKTYEVKLFDPEATFTIKVPADAKPLLQLGELPLKPESK